MSALQKAPPPLRALTLAVLTHTGSAATLMSKCLKKTTLCVRLRFIKQGHVLSLFSAHWASRVHPQAYFKWSTLYFLKHLLSLPQIRASKRAELEMLATHIMVFQLELTLKQIAWVLGTSRAELESLISKLFLSSTDGSLPHTCQRTRHFFGIVLSHSATLTQETYLREHTAACKTCKKEFERAQKTLRELEHVSWSAAQEHEWNHLIKNTEQIFYLGAFSKPQINWKRSKLAIVISVLILMLLGFTTVSILTDQFPDKFPLWPHREPTRFDLHQVTLTPQPNPGESEPGEAQDPLIDTQGVTDPALDKGSISEIHLRMQSYEWMLLNHTRRQWTRPVTFSDINYVIIKPKDDLPTSQTHPRTLYTYALKLVRQYNLNIIQSPKKLNLEQFLPQTVMVIGNTRSVHTILSGLQDRGQVHITPFQTKWHPLPSHQTRVLLHFSE